MISNFTFAHRGVIILISESVVSGALSPVPLSIVFKSRAVPHTIITRLFRPFGFDANCAYQSVEDHELLLLVVDQQAL